MKIKGIQGLTVNEVNHRLQNGAKFVIYQFTISIVVMTFRRSSNIYFVKSQREAILKGLPFSLISLLLGWWGIPWGPIYTISSFINNFQGGDNVTDRVLHHINATKS